jgi:hypothetical protein
MTKAVWGARVKLAGAVMLAVFSTSCGEMARQGQASSYLIISAIEAASGAESQTFSTVLNSDVVTVVDDVPTIYADLGRARFLLGLKDPGGTGSPAQPTPNNFITINRYHVKYIRADGRNTQGVDVPYEFDGAATITVGGEAEIVFTLVRIQAKEEAPLRAMAANGGSMTAIAEVTFYGRDQTGREVSISGRIEVNFANFADPD